MMKMTAAAATTSRVSVRTITSSAPAGRGKAKGSTSRVVPVKPMGVSVSLHAPHALHAQPTLVETPAQKTPKAKVLSQAARMARRDRVVLEHLPLVKAIAVRVHENLPVHVDLDDLVHAGILGLFDAANKFNPEKQVVFSSYAKHRIKGAILDSLRQLDWASRDMRRRHKQVEAATRDLAATLQRAPTEAEVAEKLGMDVERWRTMMLDLRNVGSGLGFHALQRERRSSRTGFPGQARNATRFDLRPRATAQRARRSP